MPMVRGVSERDDVAVGVEYECVYAGRAEIVGSNEEVILSSMRGEPAVARATQAKACCKGLPTCTFEA